VFMRVKRVDRLAVLATPSLDSCPNKQGDQFFRTHLAAPMSMHLGVKHRPFGQHVGGIKMRAGTKHFGRAVLQTNLHLALQDEHPLGVAAHMERASKTHRTAPQLQALAGHECTQQCLWRALVQGNRFCAKTRAAIGVGEKHGAGELVHGRHHKQRAGYNLPSFHSLWIYTMTRCNAAKTLP